MAITKPSLEYLWAAEGDKIAPPSGKQQQGWISEIPPHQWENWLQHRQDQMLAYINQHGIVEWDKDTEYVANKSYAQGKTDGRIYKCLVDNIDKDPENDTEGNWEVAFVVPQDIANKWLPLDGSVAMQAPLKLAGDATEPLEAVTLQQLEAFVQEGDATETNKGIIRIATKAETLALLEDEAALTPFKLGHYLANQEILNDVATAVYNQSTDTWLPHSAPKVTSVHAGMRRCLLKDGVVQYYLDPHDSTKKENGTNANLTGVDGEVMVEILKTYYRVSWDGDIVTWEVSGYPQDGFSLHPAFENNVEKVYIGAFNSTVYSSSGGAVINGLNLDNNTSRVNLSNDYLCSRPNNYGMCGLTRAQFRTLARNANLQLLDFWQEELLKLLFVTEFGSLDSQAMVGIGNSFDTTWPANSGTQGDSLACINGLSLSLGNQSGGLYTTARNSFVSYRGIENLWGNLWQWIDGCNVNNYQYFICNDPALYEDDTAINYTAIGSPVPNLSASYIKNIQESSLPVFLTKSGGGASSTYFRDGFWSDSGWRALASGGNANGGLLSGVFAVTVVYASGNSSRGLGGRVSYRLIGQ